MEFKLNHAVGANVDMHVDDVVTIKKAMNRLGYYEPPDYGIKPWTDDEMFTAVGDFQRDHGLRVDEFMYKDGRTARRIERALDEQEAEREAEEAPSRTAEARRPKERRPFQLIGRVGDGRANGGTDLLASRRALAWAGYYPAGRAQRPDPRADGLLFDAVETFQDDAGLKTDGWMRPGGETERTLNQTISPIIQAHAHTGGEAEEGPQPLTRARPVRKPIPPGGENARAPEPPAWARPVSPERRIISNPTGGGERNDSEGSGWYGATRIGEGGIPRTHRGLDILATPGEAVLSPIDGVIERHGTVYWPDPKKTNYDLVVIRGTGRHAELVATLLYVDRSVQVGTKVTRGETTIGDAQDVRTRHGDEMEPHVHLGVVGPDGEIDPATLLPDWTTQRPVS